MNFEKVMSGFLEQVAAYLHRVYGDHLHRFCIVFPNIRAGLFFRKYLALLSDKPVWAPTFRSLNSLMEEIAGLTQADNLTLIFNLYRAYMQHKPSNESFEDFYFWGEMLLNDFDDVDKHLVNARDLFRNVSDLKEIDQIFDYLTEKQKEAICIFWQDFNSGIGTGYTGAEHTRPLQTDFANVWKLLYPIYLTFKQQLKTKELGYEGMIQREAALLFLEGNTIHLPYEKYVFIGFNALTPCETHFLKSLQKQDRGIFFWDYDDYYLNNTWHEAGIFMRENLRNFPSEEGFKFPVSSFRFQVSGTSNLKPETLTPKLKIISVPSDSGQTKVAGQLLHELSEQERTTSEKCDWNRVAVVLPDEYLLLPMLSSVPEVVSDINITMGYPFTVSPANSLFERLAGLQQHIRDDTDGLRFNHQDVCMILYHPYIQNIIPDEANFIIQSIIKNNRIYVPVSELPEHRLIQLIFTRCTHARDFSEYLLAIISELVTQNSNSLACHEVKFETEYLYSLFSTLQRIHDILTVNNMDMGLHIFFRLLRKVFISLKTPFSGEPLKGLQLMGMLETRALDFDHVIILSMNEGIFPKTSSRQSFIPYNLRKGFGLTTSEHHDAVSAYHFYRLIQRAKNVHLIYNSAASDNNTGEMSRFLSQIIYEPVFDVQQHNITFRVNISHDLPIVKERTDDVRSILGMYTAETGKMKRLSPSALNTYIDCQMKFYFRYVEGLKEKEEVMDEIDYSIFGKLLHKTMELIYTPFLKMELTAGILTQVQRDEKNIRKALYRAFAEDYFHTQQVTDNDINGRNIIIREVLLKYIMRILDIDRNATPFTILNLEEPLDVSIPICKEGYSTQLNMHGYIDRLDFTRNTLRIIDYKTGNAQRNFTGIADLFNRNKAGNHAVLQTLVYACMTRIAAPVLFQEWKSGEKPGISSCLYITKELFHEDYDPRIYISRKPPIENYFDVAHEFEAELNLLLSEMFLSDEPFTQTGNLKKCVNCLYADICHRNG